MSRTYSTRVMRFRQGVYTNRDALTPMCQVLLLRLADSMDAKAIVSVPRSQLAKEFNCEPPRITEWMKQCREAKFLSIVRRGRPGVTAVYQGMYVAPSLVRVGVPSTWYAEPDQAEVREGVPSAAATWYAQPPTQEVVQTETLDGSRVYHLPQRGSGEESA